MNVTDTMIIAAIMMKMMIIVLVALIRKGKRKKSIKSSKIKGVKMAWEETLKKIP